MATVAEHVTAWLRGEPDVDDPLAVASTIAAMDRCTSELELERLGKRLAHERLSGRDSAALRAAFREYRRIVQMPMFRARPERRRQK